jgi:hypothetical protein
MRLTCSLTMAIFCCLTCIAVSAADDKGKSDPNVGKKSATDDATIITTVLKHFSEQKMVWAFNGRETKTTIAIHKESQGPSKIYLSDAQLKSDLSQEKWEIPNELSENLRQRNEKVASLADLKFGKAVLVADFEKVLPPFVGADTPKEYADVKAYANVWLPAYSKDRKTAVVRFRFGPTAHGATATYLLTEEDGVWKVSKWAFAYYV